MAADEIERLYMEFQEAAGEYAKTGNAFLAGSIKGEQILARYTTARDLLDVTLRRAAIVNASARLPSSVGRAPQTFKTALGEYTRVGPMLGQGGTGRVFAATDEDGRKAAIKVLSIGNLASEREKRFRNEIGYCARNTHPNIIVAQDWGLCDSDGSEAPFYVMALYPSNLRKLMESRIESLRVVPLFVQILQGMAVAHESGVWHRDLKPENVLYDPDSDQLVIADFGIAHISAPLLLTLIETKQGERLANFQYAAPEQKMRGQSVDEKADVYALGLILNEMFTGKLCFGTGYQLVANVAPEFSYLDKVIEKMIRHAPNERPSVLEALEAIDPPVNSARSSAAVATTFPPMMPPEPTGDILGQLEALRLSGARVRLYPVIPIKCASDEFRIDKMQMGTLYLHKLGSGHQVPVPLTRIKEIWHQGTYQNAATLVLDGRLQWSSRNQFWKFAPESPTSEAERAIGFGKLSSAEDQIRIDLERILRAQGRNNWLVDDRHLASALAQGRQIVYDEDGKFFRVPSGPNWLILISPGP